ncbi:16459_t:CDS:2 [Funneliformis caledonium]|uniref:16459_t:CDS:1 n=1 Tax=Funneliformis caledonium TaxID=1117310 RepID=A0A9N9CTA2_9GLOM|nr:16459_t:CDS:2 [Funneliformis caledonium]
MKRFVVKEWAELISDPINFKEQTQLIFDHADLPVVKDELSLTLRLKIQSHNSFHWAVIFGKGTEGSRTPRLELIPNKSSFHVRFSSNWSDNVGIQEVWDGLLLDRWYHLAYTISDSEKRLDFYIDGKWVGFDCIPNIKTGKVVFNDGPLYIGQTFKNGDISNFRYFNWRLSADEVKEDSLNTQITYGSKVAFVHVPTGKYLSTKGIKYDYGQLGQQHMVVGTGRKIDLKNDLLKLMHQATGGILHSHVISCGSTPLMKHQQGRNGDDDWLIQRYNSIYSKDDSVYVCNNDMISLIHFNSNNTALYSHPILFGDGSQEVSCHGNGNDENNKWRIELVDDSEL